LSKSEVKAIFIGGATSYNLTAVGLTAENKTRAFCLMQESLVMKTESRIQSYWAQMRFSGVHNNHQESSIARTVKLTIVGRAWGTVSYV